MPVSKSRNKTAVEKDTQPVRRYATEKLLKSSHLKEYQPDFGQGDPYRAGIQRGGGKGSSGCCIGARECWSRKKTVVKTSGSGIMKPSDTKEVADVHVVGKIDQEIYQCITNDIVTDEVIITDERIEHIKERHPNDYERFCSYIPEMISNPDYIIEANKPNTGVILKEIEEHGEKFKLVLVLKSREIPMNIRIP